MKHYSLFIPLVLSLMACSSGSKERGEKAPVDVRVARAELSQEARETSYVGTVEAETTAKMSFSTPGTIKRLYVEEGQSIGQGQLIAELDPSLYQISANAAKASYEQAKDALERLGKMYENQSLPEIKYVEAKTNLERAKAQLDAQSRTLRDTKLYATMSGVVGKKFAVQGENVGAGTPIITLLDIGRVKVKVSVPEREIARLQDGTRAQINIPALGEGVSYEARLTERALASDPRTRTYEARFEIANPNKSILPGMVCTVGLELSGQSSQSLILPNQAVQVGDKGHFVWVVEQGKARQQAVELGELSAKGVRILSGVANGTQVIVDGMNKVSQGTKVNILK